jgi:very-short-patch-repair endonuclease
VRGVYRVGPIAAPLAMEMAAVLASGPTAAVCHVSAARLYKLLPYPAMPGPIHITVTGTHRSGEEGIVVHRTRSLPHYDIRDIEGIPVTSPNRTLIDLAANCTDHELEIAVAEAFALRLTSRSVLLKAVRGTGRKRGIRRLRALNFRIGRWEVDFYWPEYRLVVEVDAYSTHSSPRAFERDRRKDADLQDRGLVVHRVTANRIRDEPRMVLAGLERRMT